MTHLVALLAGALSLADDPTPAAETAAAAAAPAVSAPAVPRPLTAASADAVVRAALEAVGESPAAASGLDCAEPELRCAFETTLADNAKLADLLGALQDACGTGGVDCHVYLVGIEGKASGHKTGELMLFPGPAPAAR